MPNKRVSIKEIAALSGVSTATVSRVINHNGRFSEATRQRVEAVIKASGYETNTAAKGLRMQRTNTIGVVVPDLNNAFFAKMVAALEQQFFQADYSTIICDAFRQPEKEQNYLKMLDAKMVDGIVVISGLGRLDTDQLGRRVPIICIDRLPSGTAATAIGSDHFEGGCIATQELIKAGTVPIMLVGSHRSPSAMERVEGYRSAMTAANISENQQMIRILTAEEDQGIDIRRHALREFLRERLTQKGSPPIGIFATSDTLAADLLVAARQLFLSVPQDLKIIGFDDTPLASYCYPELSTIQQNVDAIAAHTWQYLLQAIQQSEPFPETRVKIPVKLIKRATV